MSGHTPSNSGDPHTPEQIRARVRAFFERQQIAVNSPVLTVDEARPVVSVERLRRDLICSAARGQGPTFIAAKIDLLIATVERRHAIEILDGCLAALEDEEESVAGDVAIAPLPPTLQEYRDYLHEKLVERGVPDHLHSGLLAYFTQRRPTGDFLRACLENNFMNAALRADDASERALRRIGQFLAFHTPGTAWGSADTVAHWLAETSPVPTIFD